MWRSHNLALCENCSQDWEISVTLFRLLVSDASFARAFHVLDVLE